MRNAEETIEAGGPGCLLRDFWGNQLQAIEPNNKRGGVMLCCCTGN